MSRLPQRALLALSLVFPASLAWGAHDLNGVWFAQVGSGSSLQRFVLVLHQESGTNQVLGYAMNREMASVDAYVANSSQRLVVRETLPHGQRTFEFYNIVTTPTSGVADSFTSSLEIKMAGESPVTVETVAWKKLSVANGYPKVRHWRVKFEAATYWEGTYWFAEMDWGPSGPPVYSGTQVAAYAEPAYATQHCRPLGCEARLTAFAASTSANTHSMTLEKVSGAHGVPLNASPNNAPECTEAWLSGSSYGAWQSNEHGCSGTGSDPGPGGYTLFGATNAQDATDVLRMLRGFVNAVQGRSITSLAALFDTGFFNDGVCFDGVACTNKFKTVWENLFAGVSGDIQAMIGGARRIRTDYDDPRINAFTQEQIPGLSRARNEMIAGFEWSYGLFGNSLYQLHWNNFGINDLLFWIKRSGNDFKFYGNGEAAPLAFQVPYDSSNSPAWGRVMEPAFVKRMPTNTTAYNDHREGGRGWSLVMNPSRRALYPMEAGKIRAIEDMKGPDETDTKFIIVSHRPGLETAYQVASPASGVTAGQTVSKSTHLGDAPPNSAGVGSPKVTGYSEGNFICPSYFFTDSALANFSALFKKADLLDRFTEPFACNRHYETYPMIRRWTQVGGTPLSLNLSQTYSVAYVEFERQLPTLSGSWSGVRPVRFYDSAQNLVGSGNYLSVVDSKVGPSPNFAVSDIGKVEFTVGGQTFCANVTLESTYSRTGTWVTHANRAEERSSELGIAWTKRSSTGTCAASDYPSDAASLSKFTIQNWTQFPN